VTASAPAAPGQAGPQASAAALWPVLLATGAAALLARWLAYTGFFGSDEVTYIGAAWRVLDGDWTLDDYVGANRLGVNWPMALAGAVFGRTELGAAFYSLACGVLEAVLVAWIAGRMFGLRAAWFAGLLFAALPTQVHFSGRIMADAPVALAISAAFVLFMEAHWRRSAALWFAAGLCVGASFWIKPVMPIVFGVLLLWPLLLRRFEPRWLWMVAGLGAALLLSGLVHQQLTGNFWYVFQNVSERRQSGYLERGVEAGHISGGAWVYFEYLFAKIYHTGLVGPLALVGVLSLLWRRCRLAAAPQAVPLLLLWGPGMLGLLSFLPVSFDPWILIPKQVNYMLAFVAPLAVLAGVGLAALPPRWGRAAAGAAVVVGLGFALLLQLNIATFVANSRATLAWLQTRPDAAPVHVMQNAWRAAQFEARLGGPDLRPRLHPLREIGRPSERERWVVVDGQTWDWEQPRPEFDRRAPPACWQAAAELRGEPLGAGAALLRPIAAHAAPVLPLGVRSRLAAMLEPVPARVYRVPAGC
jgi:4-amino-4-deoxy-L-arabinose transferase-like glycosyltransferase